MSNPNMKAQVHLTQESRQNLKEITRNGCAPAKMIRRARVLLMADQHHPEGRWKDAEIAKALDIHVNTVAKIRRSFVCNGETATLQRRQRCSPPVAAKMDGEKEAQLIAICCSEPPQGRVRWTMSLLAAEMQNRQIVTQISRETVRQTLKKTNCDLGRSNATASRSET